MTWPERSPRAGQARSLRFHADVVELGFLSHGISNPGSAAAERDAKKEVIVGDSEASKLLTRNYRAPWKLA